MIKFRRFRSFIPTCPPPRSDTGCTYCKIPDLPSDKPIDFSSNLNNTKVLPWKHLLVLTHNITDFNLMPSRIEFIPNSLNSKLYEFKTLFSSIHPILVSNILLNNHQIILKEFNLSDQEQLVFLYPDNKIIQFDIKHTQDFVRQYLIPKGIKREEVYNPFKKEDSMNTSTTNDELQVDLSNFKESPISKDLIVTCGHTARDIRCGKIAPLINNELIKVCDKKQLDIDIGLISHIGGHVYAGNLIYFPSEKNKEVVWYGRVFPDKVQGIIDETVINGRIIKDLYRGEV